MRWLTSAWLLLASAIAFAQTTGHATINVTGSISGGACAISTQTIDMGSHDPAEFTGVGAVTRWVDFPITSEGCTPDIVSVHMRFDGNADTDNANVFAVSMGGATGLGIQLQGLDAAKTNVIPNSTSELVSWVPAPAGEAYPMRARYVQTKAKVTPGEANGTVTVLLSYN